jgi:hypothetical protein
MIGGFGQSLSEKKGRGPWDAWRERDAYMLHVGPM